MSKRIGITFGSFDLVHPGHLTLFKMAKEECDELIIGLQTDPSIERSYKNKPIQSMYERYLILNSCKYVDRIVPYDTEKDIENMLCTIRPDVYFVGDDHKDDKVTGHDLCGKLIISICFLPRDHSYSSTELRERICGNITTNSGSTGKQLITVGSGCPTKWAIHGVRSTSRGNTKVNSPGGS